MLLHTAKHLNKANPSALIALSRVRLPTNSLKNTRFSTSSLVQASHSSTQNAGATLYINPLLAAKITNNRRVAAEITPKRQFHDTSLLKSAQVGTTTYEEPVGANLIPIVNQLQEVVSLVGETLLDLPQIVVIGAQSSGKSSVLENLVGKDFLPRGSGLVTRRPLILQLNRLEDSNQSAWGEFFHKPGVKISNFDDLKREIVTETENTVGKNSSRISAEPIILKIFSPNVLPLTLVDTPGITRVPIGDQPSDIEQQIRDMVHKYISQPNAIILAVQAATADLATSDALKLAREVDPLGERTIGVLTKVDIMDKGTNAVNVLSGRTIPLKLGFIGVINRSQHDIDVNKPIKQMLRDETKFFQEHPIYQSVEDKVGTQILAQRCNRLLSNHIQKNLSSLKNQIKKKIKEKQAELQNYGIPMLDMGKAARGGILMQQLNEFLESVEADIEGTRQIQLNQLNGGARIRYILHDSFAKHLEKIDALEGITVLDIRTAIRNASGSKPSLVVPEKTFDLLIKRQIPLLKEPSQRCAELILEELLRIVTQIDTPEMARFRTLRDRVIDVSSATLRRALKPTNEQIEHWFECELDYINTTHRDFMGTDLLNRGLQIDTANSKDDVAFEEELRTQNAAQKKSGGGFFSSLWGGSAAKESESPKEKNKMPEPPAILRMGENVSDNDKAQIKLIQQLIRSYFKIVQRNVQDNITKIVMHFLIKNGQRNLRRDLFGELFHEDMYDVLLREDPSIAMKRKIATEQLEALKKAKKIIQNHEKGTLGTTYF